MTGLIPRPNLSMTRFLAASARIFQPKTGAWESSMTIRNVFMKAEDKFPSSRDFHALLGKPENKSRLQAFLQNEFQRTAATTDTEII